MVSCSSTTAVGGFSKSSLCRVGRMYIPERRYGLRVQMCAFTTVFQPVQTSCWNGNPMTFGVLMLCHCRKRTRKETQRKPAALTGCFSREGTKLPRTIFAGETHKTTHNSRKRVGHSQRFGAEKKLRMVVARPDAWSLICVLKCLPGSTFLRHIVPMIFLLKISVLNTLWQADPHVFARDFQDCSTKIVVAQGKSKSF